MLAEQFQTEPGSFQRWYGELNERYGNQATFKLALLFICILLAAALIGILLGAFAGLLGAGIGAAFGFVAGGVVVYAIANCESLQLGIEKQLFEQPTQRLARVTYGSVDEVGSSYQRILGDSELAHSSDVEVSPPSPPSSPQVGSANRGLSPSNYTSLCTEIDSPYSGSEADSCDSSGECSP